MVQERVGVIQHRDRTADRGGDEDKKCDGGQQPEPRWLGQQGADPIPNPATGSRERRRRRRSDSHVMSV
jgi:hypothetical protein